MKTIKILLTPIRILLTIAISIFKLLLSFSSTILAIIAFVVFMVSVFFFIDGEKKCLYNIPSSNALGGNYAEEYSGYHEPDP